MQTLNFDNQFIQTLPGDPLQDNVRRQLRNAIWTHVSPAKVRAPYLVAYSEEAAELIGLTAQDCRSDIFLQVFAGNDTVDGMATHATCYGGHQFGNWAGQLGDGRAINLGEVKHNGQHWMLQLKGAGPTPFSRTADGLAVMRSSVREFLCSEAMFHLGVPTTRALSLIGTGEDVLRDMLYDGHPEHEPGAVVCRVSPSFVRFGHFQMLAARNETDLLRTFTDYVIQRDFQHLVKLHTDPREKYIAWFNEVCQRTAQLMVHWMRVGFVHGVMNTDNMSILGETIDYGPYGWLEDFDPHWTPNTTDAANRRYRYDQQPAIGQWNLMQLANAVKPLLEDTKPLEAALSDYARNYEAQWQQMIAEKLGLSTFDAALSNDLFAMLTEVETDMTLFFRALAKFDPAYPDRTDCFADAYYQPEQLTEAFASLRSQWLAQYVHVMQQQGVGDERRSAMNAVNPKFVLRNYLAQLAIDDAQQGDFAYVNKLLDVLRKPYDEQPANEIFAAKRPEWARTRVGCSMLSCSS
ncbi:MAG: YdiU family protein [bacterium]